ncbi:hypothetical protein F3I62_16735 [Pseudomonas sp. R-28-1W-6]|uniref:hypothetical protein n=1 Tax=Pseudomonas sp. R-28-1W-6 TaxID=2650101 RepID=UPI001365B1E2|nr:hypothetical protein [Pseudomonas sp. R-28-1W-6]MWV13748.1 hypothetical protein [Pseudomonas sp. R-28-1W-6]
MSCSYTAGGTYSTPRAVSYNGCEYIPSPGGNSSGFLNSEDPSNSYCVAQYAATGDPMAAGEAPEVADEDVMDQDDGCTSMGVHTFCQDPEQPNCGSMDGQAYCYSADDTCGTVNGEFMCVPDTSSRKCTYSNGVYVCINPQTGEQISDTSADHPNNGGNADGDDTNDEQAPGSVTVGGGSQGTSDPATNKAILDMQDYLGDRLDTISDQLGEDTESVEGLKEPNEKGSFDLDEWDDKIDAAKEQLKTKTQGMASHFNSVNSWFINGGGGSLPCEITELARICVDDYSDQLVGIRYVLLFVAALIAVFIVFVKE